MSKWSVYKSGAHWIAHRDWHVSPHATWIDAYLYAYRHAMAAIHEVP